MAYQFETNIPKDEYDTFVKKHPLCNLLQSYDWANVKNNWDHIYTGVYDHQKLVATGLVLIRKLPLHRTMFYIPRGPILDYENERLVGYYFQELKRIAKKRHCLFIKFDPAILISSHHLDEEKNTISYEPKFKNIQKIGTVHHGFTQDFTSTVQPRFHMVEYYTDFGKDQLTKKGKKNLKIAQKNELQVHFGQIELLDDFVDVMKCTEKRKGIQLRSKKYFQELLDIYKDNAFITLGYFSIVDNLKKSQERYKKCMEDLKNCPENAKKKRFTLEELKVSLEKKITQYSEDQKKYGDIVCICGTLTIIYGKTAEILYAGMNDQFKRLMGPYLTWYETMQRCFDQGCKQSNMGGIEGNLSGGLVDFKEIYHPHINEFIGEFDLPVNKPLFKLSEKAYTIAKSRAKEQ